MKNPTLQKVMLTTMALVASLAFSVQAGEPNQDGPGSLSAKGARITQQQQTVHATTAADSGLPTVSLPVGTLWYNGDFDGVNGLANEQDTSLGSGQYAHTYDDFNVPAGPGWNVGSVFSNNLENTNVIGATYEIHIGLSECAGGILVAMGTTMTPCVTPTGRSGFGFTEYQIQVPGLNLNLPPGTYFLNVTPIGDLTGRSFVSTTSGTNCIGTPCGNNQNAFFDSNFFSACFTSTANVGQPYDYSMGVSTSPGCCVPPPSGFTLWLPFDETSGTTSANLYPPGNSGTQINNPTVTSGYVDHSLCFNGKNQRVTVPNYAAIDPGKGNLSIDAWVMRSSLSGNTTRVIVDHRKAHLGQLRGYHLAVCSGHLIFQLADGPGYTNYTDTAIVPADNQWHFVAVTVNRRSPTGGQFYVDCAATATFDPTLRLGSLDFPPPIPEPDFWVAAGQIAGNSPWRGCIDEVEFFPRVLAPAEIQSICGAGSAGKCKPESVQQGSCAPSSSLAVLVSGTNVIAYVPKGCWLCGATGIAAVNIEGTSITNTLIPTGSDVINSCASNPTTGQTVCTANNAKVYVLKGTMLDPAVIPNPLTSSGSGTISFTGGSCTNCGVAMDATHNRAVIAMSTLNPPVGFVGGFQFLDLNTATLGNVFASLAPPGGQANISEGALIDPIRNLLLSASENNNYELIDVAPTPSPSPFYENPIPNTGDADSSGEDCSTGIALAPYEGSFPSQVLVTDLDSAVFTPGSPGSWTSSCSMVNTLTESFLSAGPSGIAVAQGTHTGIASGEFGGDAITAIALPPTSGLCVLPDWLSCKIGGGFSNGRDPHTVTAYRSPNSPNHAFALLANGGATTLAVVDLTNMLNPTVVPRTIGSGLGHGCASTPLPATVVNFIPVP